MVETSSHPSVNKYPGWRAPFFASTIAAILLFILLIPGVLRYPDKSFVEINASFEENRLRASNESLEEQLKALREETKNKLCKPTNFSIPVPGLKSNPTAPTPQFEVNPPKPDVLKLPHGQLPSSTNQGKAITNVRELLDQVTVLILVLSENSTSQGTGFFISDRHIVTNHHVVRNATAHNTFIVGPGIGGIRRAKPLVKSEPAPSAADLNSDAAVLETDSSSTHPYLKLGPTPPKLATAYVAGFPGFLTEKDTNFRAFVETLIRALNSSDTLDRALSAQSLTPPSADLRSGRINNSIRSGARQLSILIHDMQLAPGNSGGPLIDSCGRLIGINTLLFSNDEAGAQQGNVAQDVSVVRDFLKQSRISFESDESSCNPQSVVQENLPATTIPPSYEAQKLNPASEKSNLR